MPPLREALVEVHKEYAKASRVAKDMANLYKKATTAADMIMLNARLHRPKTNVCRNNSGKQKNN